MVLSACNPAWRPSPLPGGGASRARHAGLSVLPASMSWIDHLHAAAAKDFFFPGNVDSRTAAGAGQGKENELRKGQYRDRVDALPFPGTGSGLVELALPWPGSGFVDQALRTPIK